MCQTSSKLPAVLGLYNMYDLVLVLYKSIILDIIGTAFEITLSFGVHYPENAGS